MLLGEVKGNRKRLEQNEAIIVDRRQPAVRIDREKFGHASARITDLDRDMLVIDAQLRGHPERAESAGAGNPVDAQAGHLFSGSRSAYSTIVAASQ
jgi:hypothetical protein